MTRKKWMKADLPCLCFVQVRRDRVYYPAMEPANSNPETLSGRIERVVFHNPENGFVILKLKIAGERQHVTVQGHAASASIGECAVATGEWATHAKYGRQFQAATLEINPPSSRQDLVEYLASGQFKGVGPQLAKKLVQAFGNQVFEVIEKHPSRLRNVSGVGPALQKQITASWRQHRAAHEVMSFLQQHGLGTALAIRIHKFYGDAAINQVSQHPYQLIEDIPRIGFEVVDQLALKLGTAIDSPERARAGVEYSLKRLTAQGHCAFPENDLVDKAARLLSIDKQVIQAAINQQVTAMRLVRDRLEDEDCIYPAALYEAETQLVDHIRRLEAADHPLAHMPLNQAMTRVAREIRKQLGFDLSAAQRDTVAEAAKSKVLIITGGPGTGKTTIIAGIVKLFAAGKRTCLLCAPTGRAAKRMTEATGRQAKTIHRLLGVDPETYEFDHDADNPLDTDLVLVDEASMLDLPLAYALVQAIPSNAALILVGDADQLPSIGPGVVLRDLIASKAITTAKLTQVYRQAARSRIIEAAGRVNKGQIPDLQQTGSSTDFYFCETQSVQQAQKVVVEIVSNSLSQHRNFNPLKDIQVLTPMNKGDLGTRSLNPMLQDRLNPAASHKPEIR
ncbi:MAG: ATP-dependent RecD-like DNA helicase, partial [Planctomycetes bacterium]|nr:ATP-dependent RecD-like DNA helicase [Planctomycetota bacterium]